MDLVIVEMSFMLPGVIRNIRGYPVSRCMMVVILTSLDILPLCLLIAVNGKCILFGIPVLSIRIAGSEHTFSLIHFIWASKNRSTLSRLPIDFRKSDMRWDARFAFGKSSRAMLPSYHMPAWSFALSRRI